MANKDIVYLTGSSSGFLGGGMIGRVKIIDLEWAGEDHFDCLFGNAKECQWIIPGDPLRKTANT